jgi:hypothetical protein
MNRLEEKHSSPGDRKAVADNTYGRCCYSIRTIFVREHAKKGGRLGEWVPMRKKGWRRYVSRPWNYGTQKHTLVHELVHYRFPSMQHGKKFEQRIKDIFRGQSFELQHIHLFAASSKYYTVEVDGSTEEEIKKYRASQDRAEATRKETNRKRRLYWQLHDQLKDKLKDLDWETQSEVQELLRVSNNRRIPIDKNIRRLQKKLDELTMKKEV